MNSCGRYASAETETIENNQSQVCNIINISNTSYIKSTPKFSQTNYLYYKKQSSTKCSLSPLFKGTTFGFNKSL